MINDKLLDSLTKLLIFQRLSSTQKNFYGNQLCFVQKDVLSDNVDDKFGGLISGGYNSYTPTTNLLKSQKNPINNIFVSATYKKDDQTPDPTYSISLDNGITWKDGIQLNTIGETKGLKSSSDGTYDLLVKFKMGQNPIANSWIARTSSPNGARAMDAGISFSPTNSFITGATKAETFSDVTNSWINRIHDPTDITTGSSHGMNFTLDIGVIAGGYSGEWVGNIFTREFFCGTFNWIMKSNMAFHRHSSGFLTLTSDLGIIMGGVNSTQLNLFDSYKFSSNIWSSINSCRSNGANEGISLTSNLGLMVGGENGYTAYTQLLYNTLYNYSQNTFLDKTNIPFAMHDGAPYSLTTDLGIINSGSNGQWGIGPIANAKFSLSNNAWTYLADPTMVRDAPAAITLDSGSGITALGADSPTTYTDTVMKYVLGESSLLSFTILTW